MSNLDLQASFSGDAVKVTSYDDDSTVRGQSFAFEKNFSLDIGVTLYVLIDYTTYVPSDDEMGLVYVLPPRFATSSGPVIVNVYRGHNYSGGTEFDVINPNTLATKTTSGTTWTTGPTGSDLGTKVLEYLVGGDSQGASAASGGYEGIRFFIRNNTQKTLVEIVNNSGKVITFHYAQVIFEI